MNLILYNGKVRIAKNCFEEAVFIEDGLIKKTGSSEEILTFEDDDTIVINLESRLVLPGFNDSHMHFLNVGYNFSLIDLGETSSIDEVIECCRAYIAEHELEEGTWIQCYGWNEDNWVEKRHITRYDLDKISTSHPIVASRVCVHVESVNSKGLELLGINKDTPQPESGSFAVDSDGEPTGVLFEMMNDVYEKFPEPSIAEIKGMLLAAGEAMTATGITSVQSDDFESVPGGDFVNIIRAFEELAAEDELPVRVYEQCCLPDLDKYETFRNEGYYTGYGDDVYRLGPLKAFCDGSLGARTAWLKEEYSDDPGNIGIRIYETDDEIETLVARAHNDGMAVAIHCIGDAAAGQALTAIEKAVGLNPERDNRHGIVHAQILDDDLIARMAKSNVIAYIQPVFIEYDLKMAESRVGPERLGNSYHYRRLYDSGIKVPFGTDSPVEPFAPLMNIYCSVTGKDFDGFPEDGWHMEKMLTLDEAIECYTEHSAYASYDEYRKGKIEVGYLADLVVLDEDIFEISLDHIKDVDVFMTIMGGKIRYIKEV